MARLHYLDCARGFSKAEVAQKLKVSPLVGKWRERFRVLGMQGLTDGPRTGAPTHASIRFNAPSADEPTQSLVSFAHVTFF